MGVNVPLLRWTGSGGEIQRRSAPIGTHQQARQRAAALSAGGSGQVTVRSQPEWRSKLFHLAMRRGRKIAKVAMARKLAVHLYWMWRQGRDYCQTQKLSSQAGEPGNPHGVQSNTDVMIGHPAHSK